MQSKKLAKALSIGTISALSMVNTGKADNLEVRFSGNNGVGADNLNLEHIAGATEGDGNGDTSWFYLSPLPQIMKLYTQPENTQLKEDARPLDSESMFRVNLSAYDSNDSNGVINTETNRIRFRLLEGAPDDGRVRLGKLHIDSSYRNEGQPLDIVTNINNLISDGSGLGYLNLSGGVSIPHEEIAGTLDISSKFAESWMTNANNAGFGIDLGTNQISGLDYIVTQAPTNGVLSGTPPLLSYLANTNFVGNDQFRFDVQHEGNTLASFIQNLALTNIPNSAPFGSNFVVNLGNDMASPPFNFIGWDPEDGTNGLTFEYTPPTQGIVETNMQGSYVYTPPPGFAGMVDIAFRPRDSQGQLAHSTSYATMNVTNVSTNMPPVGSSFNFTVGRNSANNIVPIPQGMDDRDGTNVVYQIAPTTKGTFGTNAQDQIVFTPKNNYYGTFTNTYLVFDQEGLQSPPYEMAVSVDPAQNNQPPVGFPSNLSTTEYASVSGIFTAIDPEGDTVYPTIIAESLQPGAFVDVSGYDPQFTYHPSTNFARSDSFSYFFIDEYGATSVVYTSVVTRTWTNRVPQFTGIIPNPTNGSLVNLEARVFVPDGGVTVAPLFKGEVSNLWMNLPTEYRREFVVGPQNSTNGYEVFRISVPSTNRYGFYGLRSDGH